MPRLYMIARSVLNSFLPSIHKPVLLFFCIAVFISGVRYAQRYENRTLMATHHISGLERDDFIASFLDNLPPVNDPVGLLRLQPSEHLSNNDVDRLLELYSYLGLYSHEARLLSFLLKQTKHPWAVEVLVGHLASRVFYAVAHHLRNDEYELARFRSQRFINFVYSLPPGEHFREFNERLNQAWQVIKLVRGRFLYRDREKVQKIVSRILFESYVADEGPEGHLVKEPEPETIDPSLQDEAEYSNIALEAATRPYGEREILWSEFIAKFPGSSKIEEAYFNIVNDALEAYRTIGRDDPERTRKILEMSHNALLRCEDFVRRFPKSYLADDALRYSVRLAFSIGDRGRLYEAYRRLARDYRGTDSSKRTQYGVEKWLASAYGLTSRSVGLISWLLVASAQLGPNLSLGSVAGLLGQEREMLLSLVAGIFGESDSKEVARLEARTVVIRILFLWLRSSEAEERVNALWDLSRRSREGL